MRLRGNVEQTGVINQCAPLGIDTIEAINVLENSRSNRLCLDSAGKPKDRFANRTGADCDTDLTGIRNRRERELGRAIGAADELLDAYCSAFGDGAQAAGERLADNLKGAGVEDNRVENVPTGDSLVNTRPSGVGRTVCVSVRNCGVRYGNAAAVVDRSRRRTADAYRDVLRNTNPSCARRNKITIRARKRTDINGPRIEHACGSRVRRRQRSRSDGYPWP